MSEDVSINHVIAHYGEAPDGEFCANCQCRYCGFDWTAIAPWNCDLARLECPRCHAFDSDAEIVVTQNGRSSTH